MDIDPKWTAALLRHHVRAMEAAARSASDSDKLRLLALDPEVTWLVTSVRGSRALTDDEKATVRDRANASLHNAAKRPRIVTKQNYTTFDREAVVILEASADGDATLRKMSIAEDCNGQLAERVVGALEILTRVWPAAAVELQLLIERIIILKDTELTATHDQLFGVLFLGENYMESLPRTVEALLHETSHHSMFLRLWLQDYVSNPDDLVHHALRKDPRPISGTLHAAFVLWRMHYGLHRWAEVENLPADHEVSLIRDSDREKLVATLGTLADRAEWTTAGRTLFDSMARGTVSSVVSPA
ncbi:HEXXH motif-containing putative peptide modification protein [Pseudarthrobacter sp. J64]|uniref:aKG-HExxH-type peptide beta-hydroxylase n=1 Tax=Pseudarthrobacter sp. J64 TaxID=3116485 RepID=UPI002E80DE81|nr:HEXXH motif-containing putative peptide modification protein [Pseudarthrobacter sp. J64]MEE2570599.1 HEXXH motif-containing putative peptide modification protein [Pseudarthrobacter sp. J64]